MDIGALGENRLRVAIRYLIVYHHRRSESYPDFTLLYYALKRKCPFPEFIFIKASLFDSVFLFVEDLLSSVSQARHEGLLNDIPHLSRNLPLVLSTDRLAFPEQVRSY